MLLYNEELTQRLIKECNGGIPWQRELEKKIKRMTGEERKRFIYRYMKGDINERLFYDLFKEILEKEEFKYEGVSLKLIQSNRKSNADKKGVDFILCLRSNNFLTSIGIQLKSSDNKKKRIKKEIIRNRLIKFYKGDSAYNKKIIYFSIKDKDTEELKREIRIFISLFILEIEKGTKTEDKINIIKV